MRNVNLDIADGEFVVFVGPSGCGKSTLLRMIAGLEDNQRRRAVDRRHARVNDVPPAKRGIAMVFQSYALYPHMTRVRQHGVRPEARRRAESRDRGSACAVRRGILHIEHLLERKPKQLSGGQRQRVAIGRAIVAKPEGVPVRRAAFQSRCRSARADARRDRARCTATRRPR